MPDATALILGWARSAVAPHGGVFKTLHPHDIAAPVVQGLLARAGIAADMVDAVVVGNALGAGGNPARMVALAAGLPDRSAAYSVDTQCCAGLDAVSMAVGLLASGNASVVIAGGVEAWSRAPIRQHRPMHVGEAAVSYERPAFAPDPARDPDMLLAAARYAARRGYTRVAQDAYAILSHERALARADTVAQEIVPVAGLDRDAYPRHIKLSRAARMPAVAVSDEIAQAGEQAGAEAGVQTRLCDTPPAFAPDHSLSALSIAPRADGAAFVVLANPDACKRLGLQARATWIGSASIGAAPETPMLAAIAASQTVLARVGLSMGDMAAVELHDAFAVQALSFCDALGLKPAALNRRGGGLARGHPIGASAAIALVRLLADLERDEAPGAFGLTAVAGAGGIGAAAVVARGQ
ncbi:thiolase family protein [Pigmentiphaga aceris]|uniref:Thiolase family protein n=1 Tax=Pigmentiphaga aceris TaxID=1940612 RepID=A0A5C0AVV0_9BURK|nr:thiolase family protein [Pigmentiphaga aceris]QEI06499.1 thiolase family protein [Pigmentiphaga aceris]